MRDIDALLNSLISIDRNSLIAILSSEVEAARHLVNDVRQRTASQRAKRRDAEQRAARLDRILSFSRCLSATSSSATRSNKNFAGFNLLPKASSPLR